MKSYTQAYLVNQDTKFFRAGCIVYALIVPDQGCAIEDSQKTGITHVSVTKRKDGLAPSATIPAWALRRVPCKPHLWKQDGLWFCREQDAEPWWAHIGNSPEVALEAWRYAKLMP